MGDDARVRGRRSLRQLDRTPPLSRLDDQIDVANADLPEQIANGSANQVHGVALAPRCPEHGVDERTGRLR